MKLGHHPGLSSAKLSHYYSISPRGRIKRAPWPSWAVPVLCNGWVHLGAPWLFVKLSSHAFISLWSSTCPPFVRGGCSTKSQPHHFFFLHPRKWMPAKPWLFAGSFSKHELSVHCVLTFPQALGWWSGEGGGETSEVRLGRHWAGKCHYGSLPFMDHVHLSMLLGSPDRRSGVGAGSPSHKGGPSSWSVSDLCRATALAESGLDAIHGMSQGAVHCCLSSIAPLTSLPLPYSRTLLNLSVPHLPHL